MRTLLRSLRFVAIDTTTALCVAVTEQLDAERERLVAAAARPPVGSAGPSEPSLTVVSYPTRLAGPPADELRASAMRVHPSGAGRAR